MLLLIFVQELVYCYGGNDMVFGARGQGFYFQTGQIVNITEQNSVLVIVLRTRGYYGTVRNYFPYYIPLNIYRTVISYLAKIPYVTVRYGIFSVP